MYRQARESGSEKGSGDPQIYRENNRRAVPLKSLLLRRDKLERVRTLLSGLGSLTKMQNSLHDRREGCITHCDYQVQSHKGQVTRRVPDATDYCWIYSIIRVRSSCTHLDDRWSCICIYAGPMLALTTVATPRNTINAYLLSGNKQDP